MRIVLKKRTQNTRVILSGIQSELRKQGGLPPLDEPSFLPSFLLARIRPRGLGVTTDSKAFCWGFGLDGQLGNDSWSSIPHPSPVRGGLRFADVVVSASGHHSCGLLSTGATYCWGSDAFGQLGDGTAGGHTNRPLRVEGPQ